MGDEKKDFLSNINGEVTESFQEETFVKQKIDFKKWIIQIVIVAIALFAVYQIVNTKTEVINFTNMSYDNAAVWAGENDIIITFNSEYSNDVDEGYVISQDIQAGSDIKKNMIIVLDVSEGLDPYEQVEVPSFDSSWSRNSISVWLDQYDIENFTYLYLTDESVSGNFLISYRLIGATEDTFTRSSEIEFIISQTEQVSIIEMPSFLNQNLLSLDMWAKENEITYTYDYEFSSIYSNDKVMEQSAIEGEEIDITLPLAFIISKGEEISVPSFADVKKSQIQNYSDGLSVEVDEVYKSGTNEGDFISQSITVGTSVENETNIIVVYSLGDEIIVSDYTNKLLVEFEEWVDEQNESGANITLKVYKDSTSGLDYGKIISQSIYSEKVGLVSTIELSVSSGITVPSFSGMSKSEVNSNNQGVAVSINEIYKEGTDEGDFISQSIAAGTSVSSDIEVEVWYSLGDTITIPSYVNQLRIDFEKWVEEQNEAGADIQLNIYENYDAKITYGKVISQNIYNENVGLSLSIDVNVSLGELFTVPNYSVFPVSQIKYLADVLDLTVIFNEVEDPDLSSGTFISQSPESGTIISKKDFIIITVAK